MFVFKTEGTILITEQEGSMDWAQFYLLGRPMIRIYILPLLHQKKKGLQSVEGFDLLGICLRRRRPATASSASASPTASHQERFLLSVSGEAQHSAPLRSQRFPDAGALTAYVGIRYEEGGAVVGAPGRVFRFFELGFRPRGEGRERFHSCCDSRR